MDESTWENSTTAQTFEYSTEETTINSMPENHDKVAYYSFVSVTAILSLALGINIIYRCFHKDARDTIQDV